MLVSWCSIWSRQLAILKTTQLPSRDGQHHGWRIKLYDLTKHRKEYTLALYTALPVIKADTGVEADGPMLELRTHTYFLKPVFLKGQAHVPGKGIGTVHEPKLEWGPDD